MSAGEKMSDHTNHLEDRSYDPFIMIDNRILEIPLTTEAFRVYAQLKKYANKEGKCFPSYSTLAEECFRGSYPDGAASTIKKKAIAAVKELIDRGLLTKKIQNYGATDARAANIYTLTHPKSWKFESDVLSVLAHTSKKSGSPTELGGSGAELGGGSPTELGGSGAELGGGSPTELGGSGAELGWFSHRTLTISKKTKSIELDPNKELDWQQEFFLGEDSLQKKDAESKGQDPGEPLTSLLSNSGHIEKHEDPSWGRKEAPASFDNLEQSNYGEFVNPEELRDREKDRFLSGRRIHPSKKTFLSNSSDPWMRSANNPNEAFAQWVYEKRYKAKDGLLSDAKAEIKNNCERAADLWSDYQSEMGLNAEGKASTSSTQSSPDSGEEAPLRGYYSKLAPILHEQNFIELVECAGNIGLQKAIAKFEAWHDNQHPGATRQWISWIERNHPEMYKHLPQE